MHFARKKFRFVAMALAALLPVFVIGAKAIPVDKPNVIFMLMDDLGWNDLGYTGSKFYESPHIDRLAAQGVVLTRAYAAPTCSPSRASLLTGLDPARTGFVSPMGGHPLEILEAFVQPRPYTSEELNKEWQKFPGGLKAAPPNQKTLQVASVTRLSTKYPTLGKVFKANGYKTAHFGKWHIGPEPFSPLEHGFDVEVPFRATNTPGPLPPGHFGPWPRWAGQDGPENQGRNIDDCLAENAVKFIRENKDKPFYMQFWTYGVHIPFQAKREVVEYFKTKADPNSGQRNPLYAAMVKHTDDAIGRVWKAVEEAGLAEKTVLVFLSDNGGINWGMHGFGKDFGIEPGTPVSDNSPLRGGKGSVYEGGVRVPGFIIWPGVTTPGARCSVPVNARDIFPTLAEMCGFDDLPTFDGRSIAPALSGKAIEEKPVFTHHPYYTWDGNGPVTAVVMNGWKLLRFYFDGPGQTDRFELYHLEEDPGETLDCHRSRPDLMTKLRKVMDEYLKATGAVLPQPNPEYQGAIKGDFEGVTYEVLEPVFKRGVAFPLVVCLESEGNPAYAELQKLAIQNKYPMYLLAVNAADAEEKMAGMIRQVIHEYPIQPRQVYVTGQGAGATDAWELTAAHPELFAALLAVDGAGDVSRAVALKDMPVWVFGGEHDAAIPVADMRKLNGALKAAGSTAAHYTEYAENASALLNNVWGNTEVLEWLFAQSAPARKTGGRK